MLSVEAELCNCSFYNSFIQEISLFKVGCFTFSCKDGFRKELLAVKYDREINMFGTTGHDMMKFWDAITVFTSHKCSKCCNVSCFFYRKSKWKKAQEEYSANPVLLLRVRRERQWKYSEWRVCLRRCPALHPYIPPSRAPAAPPTPRQSSRHAQDMHGY